MEEEKKVNYELEEDASTEESNVEIVDDTPEEDRNKKHLGDVEVPEDEIEQYGANVQKRINQGKKSVFLENNVRQ